MNWDTVLTAVESAVKGVVGGAWGSVSAGASAQFAAIIAAGKQIEANQATMSQADYDSLKVMQQRALDGVLQAYSAISIDVAQEAAAAAWGAITGALKTAYPALGLVL